MYARLRFDDLAVCVVAVGRSGGFFSLSRFDIDLAGTRPFGVCRVQLLKIVGLTILSATVCGCFA